MLTRTRTRTLAALLTSASLTLLAGIAAAQGVYDDVLQFDGGAYTTLTVSVDGVETAVRRYEVVYTGNPVEVDQTQRFGGEPTPLDDQLATQKMIIYVPETAVGNDDAAVIMQVSNGGWFVSPVQERVTDGASYSSASDTDAIGKALSEGYVIASVGTRSRGAIASDGSYVGKAPAPVVDAKAAIRYLKLNDAVIPGSADRIVITGTSGGGGLSAAVAASGNSAEFNALLAEIGAAGIDAQGNSTLSDDVFATIAYVPITDLGNADLVYEWQYNGVRTADNTAGGAYSDAAQAVSAELASRYPAYLESLGITLPDGTPLTAETMDDAIVTEIKRETRKYIENGGAIPALGESFSLTIRGNQVEVQNDWLSVENDEIAVDYDKFLSFVAGTTALKAIPAFDATATTGRTGVNGENTLFGTADQFYANFTEYGWNNNEVLGDGTGLDDTGLIWAEYIALGGSIIGDQLRLIDPFVFIGTDADTAPFWYVRHGMIDRDTAFAVNLSLYHALLNDASVQDVNFELALLTGHTGNYDVQEAYSWLASSLASVDIAPVPVPAGLPLMLGGLGILGLLKRRKQRRI
ncbi:MAG: subtype B tannase [Paracoccus sp. (in: a-proteobacteria)]|uniref:subtype B tannase n=1 Tax=Paracoccus sp. TaxID=267 RepID=UPI0026E0D0B1|nr:subtype B tannase [Paracoccus sp. (in: a-proteobacteria)]MDO5613888.1 subtype B tannase [Paracoccus sp. (in: a-proteobacteria)]